jgi:hypothetical protein
VRLAAFYGPYRANCLEQSLVIWWILRRQGLGCELRIGVRKQGSHFEAHAWVECQGVALNEENDVYQRFAPFNRPFIRPGVKS